MRAACGVDENDAVRVARFNDSFREEVRLMLWVSYFMLTVMQKDHFGSKVLICNQNLSDSCAKYTSEPMRFRSQTLVVYDFGVRQ